MNISVNISASKLNINWNNVNADLYIVYMKKENIFYECARTSDTFTSISLVAYGDNEIFVKAYRNGIEIDKSPVQNFKFSAMDIVCLYENDKSDIKILYSQFPQAQGYRLYRNETTGYNGFKNSFTESITINNQDKAESYKIKPFKMDNNEREILCSSQVFYNPQGQFKDITLYKSYKDDMFLSWEYDGYCDGFLVCSQYSNHPVFETSDGKCHCASLKGFRNDTKFKICAFINTINGRIIIDNSEYTTLMERKFSHPEVSLIIPAYNAQDYIARSIDSALASNFDDLEIIIVNDGSQDNTQEIIDWYCDNYPNVISFQKENGGVADTRNYGINNANGKYIAFLDNDDMIRPQMISTLYSSITKNNCQIAIAPLYRLVDSGYTQHCQLPFEQDTSIDVDNYLKIMYTPGFYNCAIWNKLYDAELVKQHPLGLLKYEDVSWTPCIISWAKNFCFVKTPFYEWDRKTRPETFGNILAKMPEDELFEHRKQAMMFFVDNGNPEKIEYLKTIAKRRLNRYANQTTTKKSLYLELAEKI